MDSNKMTVGSLLDRENGARKFAQCVLDTLPGRVAVLDRQGRIVWANRPWVSFAESNGSLTGKVCGGADYLSLCGPAAGMSAKEAGEFVTGIRAVLDGSVSEFRTEYPRHRPDQRRWLLGRVIPVVLDEERYAVITHEEVTDRRLVEEKAGMSDARKRIEPEAVPEPRGDAGAPELSDIIESEAIQSLMDDFYRLTRVGVAVVDLNGRVLVKTGWQDICVKFHRAHPETRKNCMESDITLSRGIAPGTFKAYRCRNNMWDIATPIVVDGVHVGNIFLGQFFFEDEIPDRESFRRQAQQYGFDEGGYLSALGRVPRLSRQTVEAAMAFYARFAEIVSRLGYGSIRLASALAERDALLCSLSKSEDRCRIITNALTDVILTADEQGTCTYVSPSHRKVMGRGEEAVGRSIFEYVHPEDEEGVRKAFREAILSRSSVSAEYRYLHPSRGYIWLESQGVATDISGKPGGIIAVRDVSKRKEAEDAFKESETEYRNLVEHASEAVLVAQDGFLKYVNPTLVRMVGYGFDEVYSRPFSEFIHPDDRKMVLDNYARRTMAEDVPSSYAFRVVRKDAGIIWVQLNVVLIAWEGRPATLNLLTDITSRVDMEEALRKSEENYRRIVETANEGIWAMDSGLRITYVNRKMADMLEYEPDEMLGRAFEDFLFEEEFAHHRAQLASRIQGQSGFYERSLRRRDGSRCRCLVSSTVIKDREGRFAGSFAMFTDITDRKRMEDDLRASEEHYRRLFEEATEGIALADYETGIIKSCNQAFTRLTGYSREELIGMPQARLQPSEGGIAQVTGIFALHLGESRGEALVSQVVTATGTLRDMEIKANVLDFDGRRLVQGFFRDVTEERRGHREREATLSLLRLLNEQGHTRELIQKLIGLIQEWSGCEAVGVRLREGEYYPFYEMRGFPQGFVKAENRLCITSLDGQLTRDEACDAVPECMCGNVIRGRFNPDLPFFTARGSFWTNSANELPAETGGSGWQARTCNRCNGEGYESVALIALRHREDILGLLQINDRAKGRFTPELIAFLENVAEQVAMALAERMAREALAKSEKMFRDISNAAGEYIWEVDPAGTITYISNRVEDITGYTPAELQGRRFYEFFPAPVDEMARTFFQKHVREGVGFRNEEAPALSKTGSVVWLNTTVVPVKDAEGRLKGFLGISMDITDRKQAEEEKKRLEDRLWQSQKMEAVGQLAGGVAHDFNNLLQVILGQIDLMKCGLPEGAAISPEIEEIHDAAARAGELTKQLLTFSRRQVMQPADLNLNDVVQGVLKMIRRVIGEHIELVYSSSGPVHAVHADKGQIEQVLMNLCVNARDAMPTGGRLVIETANVVKDEAFRRENPWAQKDGYVVLRVADTGVGMDDETREHIFEPFFTTKELGRGTGLGLATVYGIVQQHQGSIHVGSRPGEGTEFRIYLPAMEQPAEEPMNSEQASAPGGHETILVAEDEPSVLQLIRCFLESAGYTVLTASNGEEALLVFDACGGEIGLVLLDVVMPRMGGREAMERIREKNPSMRFLFSSGYSGDAIHTDFVVHEGVRLIRKPYDRAEFLRAVRDALDNTGVPLR